MDISMAVGKENCVADDLGETSAGLMVHKQVVCLELH